MGKKKIVEKSKEELLKETEILESNIVKKTQQTVKHKVDYGRIYINATYNNTMITVTDDKGNVITWMSSGSIGFSGPKKATPFAASKVAEAIAQKIQRSGPVNVEVFVRGLGSGRDAAIRSLAAKGLNIVSLKDITPIPHNGPRPPKERRV
mgnify:CR=1 FL=1